MLKSRPTSSTEWVDEISYKLRSASIDLRALSSKTIYFKASISEQKYIVAQLRNQEMSRYFNVSFKNAFNIEIIYNIKFKIVV